MAFCHLKIPRLGENLVQIPEMPFPHCVTLGDVPHISEIQSRNLWNEDLNIFFLVLSDLVRKLGKYA